MKKNFHSLFFLLVTLCLVENINGQAFGDFRSAATGNWDNMGTWEEFNDDGFGGNWEPADNIPSTSDGTISIRSGYPVTVPASYTATVDQLVLDNGGSLTITSSGKLTVAAGTGNDFIIDDAGGNNPTVTVNGTLELNDGATITNAAGSDLDGASITFNSGGEFKLLWVQTTGEGKVPVASWNSNSTLTIAGYTGAINFSSSGNWGQSFGNVTVDLGSLATGNLSVNFNGLLLDINGNFSVINTNNNTSRVVFGNNQTYTVNIDGNVSITGGSRIIFHLGTGTATFNVGGDLTFSSTNTNVSTFATNGSVDFNLTAATSDFNITSGTLQFNSTGTSPTTVTVDVNGNFSNSGGTINFSSGSSTVEHLFKVVGSFSHTSGTITETNSHAYSKGVIRFDGSSAQSFTGGGTISNNVNFEINNASGVNLSSDVTFPTTTDLILSNGAFVIGANTLTINGDTVSSTSGTITGGGTSNLSIGGTGTLTGSIPFTASTTLNNFTINRTSSGIATLGSDIEITGAATFTAGDFVINNRTLTFSGTTSRTSGNLSGNSSSSVIINGSGDFGTFSFAVGGNSIGNLTLNRITSGTATLGSSLTIATTLTLTDGALSLGANTLTITGAISASAGTLTPGTSTVEYNSSGAQTIAALNYNNLILSTARTTNNITLAPAGTIGVAGTLTLSATFTSGDYVITGSTIDFNGSGAQSVNTTTAPFEAYNNLTISNTGLKTLGGVITVNGNLSVSAGATMNNGGYLITGTGAGTFSLPASTSIFQMADADATDFPASFSAYDILSGTVEYSMAGGQNISDQDYGNLTLGGSGAKALLAASTVTVAGTLTVDGTATLDMNTNAEDISVFTLDNNNTSDWIANTSNTITFNGSSAATIDDAATGTVTYGNVTFSNSHVNGTRLNTIAGTPEFGSVTISASGLFDPDAVNFNVKGAWTNNSALTAFVPDAGQIVNFNGGGAQSITSSTSDTTKFQRVRISAAGTAVTISSVNCQIAQSLDLENDASLTTGGLLTLLSDGNGTAGIEDLSDEGNTDINHIIGNVICQRYINESASAKYHALASPTTDATFNEWLDDTYVTGITGSDDAGQSFKSIKHWDEAAIAYSSPATMGTSIPNGADQSGFLVYMGSDAKQAMPKTMDVSGTVRSRTQDVTINNLSYTAGAWPGYHLLGNPWPGAFSWGAAQTNPSNSNINQIAYKLKKSAGSPYTYWNMDAADGADVDTVESGEAFWVVVSSGTNRIDFQENDKIAQGGYDSYNLKHANTTVPKIGITLQQGTFESAPIWVKFANSSLGNAVTRDFDSLVDGVAFLNGANDIATVAGDKNFAVNYLPDSINSISVPVRIWRSSPTGILKTYTIKFSKVAELSAYNKCLSFEDTYAGVSFPLTSDTSYTVSMKDTTYVPRFFVHISSPLVSSVTNIGCNGNAGGIITATGRGTGPFDYLWKNQAGDTLRNVSSSVTDTLGNLQAGIYFLSVSNNGSCGTVSDHFEIIQPEPIALSLNKTNVACFGDSSGTADVSATGGTGTFSYLWSNGSTQSQISNLKSQIYYVTVTDDGNCSIVDSVIISQPSEITVTSVATNLACNGDSNGTATAFVSGGFSPYSYVWSVGSTQSQISNLTSQIYYVTLTDNNSCSKIDSVEVAQPDILTVTPATVDVACNGDSTGQASLSVSGGVSPYSYSWNTGAGTQNIASLAPGIFSVTIMDANNCSQTNSVTINQPSPLALIISSSDALCYGGNDGIASVSVSGGTSGYSYLWSNGASTEALQNVPLGTYYVTVTDYNNCTSSASIIVNQPDSISLTLTSTNATCNGGIDGQAMVIASGGVPNYSYLWSSGGTSASESGLEAGTYTISATDNNNCLASASVLINEPTPIIITPSSNDATCGNANGSAMVSVSGDAGNLNYLWNNGSQTQSLSSISAGTYFVTVTDGNNCSNTSSVIVNNINGPAVSIASATDVSCFGGNNGMASSGLNGGTSPFTYLWSNGSDNNDLQDLFAGTYYLSVTDVNNCIGIASVIINEPTVMVLNASSIDISCNGADNGQASVSVSGGTSAYSYLWDNGNTQSQISNLTSQIFYVTVTDNNGCEATTSITITEPSLLTVAVSSTSPLCFNSVDGEASCVVNGGTAGYSYLWSSGGTSATESGLSAGTYSVSVTDLNGCLQNANTVISEPSLLTSSATSVNISCNGSNDGQATVIATGGTSPYYFIWTTGDQTENITLLTSGLYTVTVIDNNNCPSVSSISITEPYLLTVTTSAMDASCGNSDGSASVTASGGTGNYSYLWANGSFAQNVGSLLAGTYSVTVTDENGCDASVSVAVNNIEGPVAGIFSFSDVTCNSGTNGSASISVNGGTSPFTYLWSNGHTLSQVSNLSAQTYSVSITDNIGCVGITSVSINEPGPITIALSTSNTTCGNSNGSVSVTSGGGTGNHSYSWSTGDTTSAINSIAAGIYSFTVTDDNNCDQVSSASVSNITGPTVNVLSSTDVSCNSGSNGQITTNSLGGTLPYTYSWSNGAVNANISGIPSGNYSLTVTDANNCEGVLSVTINQPEIILITSTVTNALCGNSDGAASIAVIGGTGGYSYSWSNGESTPSISNLAAGSYFVLVTDANGCTKMATVSINNISGPSVYIQEMNEPSCFGLSDGSATVNATGSVPFNFLWQNSTGDTLQFSSNISSSDILQNISSGNYSILVSDNNGCGSTVAFIIDQPVPVIAAFSTSEDTVDIADGGTINLTNSSSGANSYFWNFGDGTSSSQFEPAHSFSSTGDFTISLTATQGLCTNLVQQTVVVVSSVGISENPDFEEVMIHQVGNSLFVQYNFSGFVTMEVGLFNILGQQVIPGKSLVVQSGKLEVTLPTETGVYFLKIKNQNREKVLKIVR